MKHWQMAGHGSSVGVQDAGCWALGNIASCESLGLYFVGWNAENRIAIAAKGGIEAVVRAMGAHESSAEVQDAGCWALGNIASYVSGLRSQVREADAVPLVEMALSAFPNDWLLQYHGKLFLLKLGIRSVFRF